jgi:hypothetical protein
MLVCVPLDKIQNRDQRDEKKHKWHLKIASGSATMRKLLAFRAHSDVNGETSHAFGIWR